MLPLAAAGLSANRRPTVGFAPRLVIGPHGDRPGSRPLSFPRAADR